MRQERTHMSWPREMMHSGGLHALRTALKTVRKRKAEDGEPESEAPKAKAKAKAKGKAKGKSK